MPVHLGFRALLLPLLCCMALSVQSADAPPPNMVVLLLDDMRFDDFGAAGNRTVETPNIDRLAAEGARFTQAFATTPLCSPARASLLTGRYARHNGIIDNTLRPSHDLPIFPLRLQQAGYRTGFFGKWHMGHEDDTARPGFDRWVSFVGQGVYFDPVLNIDGQTVRANGYMTDILTEQAVSFIESSPADKPFMVFLAHKASHPEVYPNQIRTFPSPAADRTLYEANELPRAPNWRAPLTGKPALAPPPGYSDPRSPPGGLPDEIVKGRLRMLSAVDRGVGELRAALEKRGVLENTVFVVTSDQGFFYGEFGLAQERRLAYEASIRIPLVIRYPGLVKGGSRPGFLVGNVDIAPTMMDIAGVRVPRGMDGKSMIDTLKDPATPLRDALLIEYFSDTEFPRLQGLGYQAIRTNRYKYIRYRELRGADELYDLNADPYELDNLLPEAAAGPLKIGLNQQLERLLRSHGSGVDANRK